LKKINKTPGPNVLTDFADENPSKRWEDFKDENGGNDYRTIRQQIFNDQGGLCAYCETKVGVLSPHKQRVEHFHPKSDDSNSTKNWGLDWNNVIGVCIGGNDANKDQHPLPANLSCDSYKNYLISKKRLSEQCEDHLLNPLKILATPSLFELDKKTFRVFCHRRKGNHKGLPLHTIPKRRGNPLWLPRLPLKYQKICGSVLTMPAR